MRLSIRDLIPTLLVAAIGVPYVGVPVNGEMPFLQDPRGESAPAAILVPGRDRRGVPRDAASQRRRPSGRPPGCRYPDVWEVRHGHTALVGAAVPGARGIRAGTRLAVAVRPVRLADLPYSAGRQPAAAPRLPTGAPRRGRGRHRSRDRPSRAEELDGRARHLRCGLSPDLD